MNTRDGVPASVDLEAGGDDILILRPDAEVELRSLPPGGAEFVEALGDDLPIVEATKAAMMADDRFDLSGNLSGLMRAKAFVGIEGAADPLPLKPSRGAG